MGNVVSKRPVWRKLRGYAFDPSLSLLIDTADINNIVYEVRWEELKRGPVGEYVEVIDFDPTVGKFYAPVDLDDRYILAEDGLPPSESNPQFHQQMVYAVSMITIQNFERALGRKVLWAPRLLQDQRKYEEYVPRLRIYPHALREANAYYSPLKSAVLFGYFSASPARRSLQMPGSLVFTCLSHDIVTHEVTHAILDGLHRNYNEPTNPDVLAFHEAFADLVALFQHFSFPEVLRDQIARTKGDLNKQNLLGQLAQQFGVAIGKYGSLRDALGSVDPKTGVWQKATPNPTDYERSVEPHQRGSILVAAVFDAFLTIYKSRIVDLLRIATGGTGVLPEGELHPDLVNRLADEAAKTAGHVLDMCIRAIDYCPPMDITFGEYLRAIITADCDLVADDDRHYRLAFISAFRRRGIYPDGIRALSVESLRYPQPRYEEGGETKRLLGIIAGFLRKFREKLMYVNDREEIYKLSRAAISGENGQMGLHQRVRSKATQEAYEFEKLTGLVFNKDGAKFGVRGGTRPSFQIVNLRLVNRVGPGSGRTNQIVLSLVQEMGVICDDDGDLQGYFVPRGDRDPGRGRVKLKGGCTLIFDLDTLELRYAIAKPLLDPELLERHERRAHMERVRRQREFQRDILPLTISEVGHYFGAGADSHFGEPFALLHNAEGGRDG